MKISCIIYILNRLLSCLASELSSTPPNTYVDENEDSIEENNETNWSQIKPENNDDFLGYSSTDCGVRNSYMMLDNVEDDLGYIVGGSQAKANWYPWAIALYFNKKFICGGTIISDRHVLSAAHCVASLEAKNFQIRAGAHNIPESGKLYNVKSVKVHPKYDRTLMNNDIAIFEVKAKFNFKKNKKLRPICLPTVNMDKKGNEYDGELATIVGWGTLFAGGTPSATLRQVQVPIIPRNECAKMFGAMITKNQICAGYRNGSKDSCQGDSGGSLCIQANKKYYQLGIVSWGKGCGEKNAPGVYTRITQYLSWISKNTF